MNRNSKQTVFNMLRKMQPGTEFTAPQLKNQLLRQGDCKMDGTITRYIRDYRKLYGVDIECINRQRSLYRVIG